jgi:hypothetical protein
VNLRAVQSELASKVRSHPGGKNARSKSSGRMPMKMQVEQNSGKMPC